MPIRRAKIMADDKAKAPNSDIFSAEDRLTGLGDRTAEVRDGVQYNALGLESTATHKHVAKIWQDQCTPILEFQKRVDAQQEAKIDKEVDQTDIRLDEDMRLPSGERFTTEGLNSLLIKYTDIPTTVAQHYLSTEYTKGVPKSSAMIAADKAILASRINTFLNIDQATWQAAHPDKYRPSLLVRTRPDGDGGTVVRLVASDRYGIIDNNEVLGMILEAMPQQYLGQALASHVHNDGDRIWGNILVPDQMKTIPGDSDYGTGIAFANSEIGTNLAVVNAFLFRAICLNGCIWGRRDAESGLSKKHLGEINREQVRAYINNIVDIGLSEGNSLLTQLGYTYEVPVTKTQVPAVITYLVQTNRLTVAESRAWIKAYEVEPYESAFGVVNGLTRAAKETVGQQRWNLESLAGKILSPSLQSTQEMVERAWSKTIERSSDIEDKVVARYTLRDLEEITA
jgi:hypothetical protein